MFGASLSWIRRARPATSSPTSASGRRSRWRSTARTIAEKAFPASSSRSRRSGTSARTSARRARCRTAASRTSRRPRSSWPRPACHRRINAEMLVSSTRGGWKEGATLVAQQLKAIGVHFTVNPVDEATWNGAVANDNFEAVFNGGASSPQVTMASWFGNGFSATHSGYSQGRGPRQAPAAHHPDGAGDRHRQAQGDLHPDPAIGTDLMPMVSLVEADRPGWHPPSGGRAERRESDARLHDPADRRRADRGQGRRRVGTRSPARSDRLLMARVTGTTCRDAIRHPDTFACPADHRPGDPRVVRRHARVVQPHAAVARRPGHRAARRERDRPSPSPTCASSSA